jgi:hypothetical protein
MMIPDTDRLLESPGGLLHDHHLSHRRLVSQGIARNLPLLKALPNDPHHLPNQEQKPTPVVSSRNHPNWPFRI